MHIKEVFFLRGKNPQMKPSAIPSCNVKPPFTEMWLISSCQVMFLLLSYSLTASSPSPTYAPFSAPAPNPVPVPASTTVPAPTPDFTPTISLTPMPNLASSPSPTYAPFPSPAPHRHRLLTPFLAPNPVPVPASTAVPATTPDLTPTISFTPTPSLAPAPTPTPAETPFHSCSWLLMLLVLLYSLTNHSLLVLVEAFIHSRPPGRRMVSRDMVRLNKN